MHKGPFKIVIHKAPRTRKNSQVSFFLCITYADNSNSVKRFSKTFDTYIEAAMLMQTFTADNSILYAQFDTYSQLATWDTEIVAAFKLTGKTLKTLD